MWLSLAAVQGNMHAQNNKNEIECTLSFGQLLEARILAFNWKPDKTKES